MNTLGIIFTNIHNEEIEELSRKRTTASIPFGGKYRIIDFTLSNFVNADITKVGILTNKNYQSLMDHVGSGRDWDLARKVGGVIIFPPYSSFRSDFLYKTRLEALQSIKHYILKSSEDYVVLTDCDSINTINYDDVLKQHISSGADATLVYKHMVATSDVKDRMDLTVDGIKVVGSKLHCTEGKEVNCLINVMVVTRTFLLKLLDEAYENDLTSFHIDLVHNNIGKYNFNAYEYKGVYFHLTTLENYYRANIEMINPDVRKELLESGNTIYTKVRDSAPTKYLDGCHVENSILADGCVIEGKVINSVLFRGVHVGKGSIIRDSIIMQDNVIDPHVLLDHVITDKGVTIHSDVALIGCTEVPVYVEKGKEISK